MAIVLPHVPVLVATRLMLLIAAELLVTGIARSNKRTSGRLALREPLRRGSREKGCGGIPMRFGGINPLANWSGVFRTARHPGKTCPKVIQAHGSVRSNQSSIEIQ